MRSLSVQVQPERAPGIDMGRASDLFKELASRKALVLRHSFDSGYDNGAYFNFTFGTERPAELWLAMQDLIFSAKEHHAHMAVAAMAMCPVRMVGINMCSCTIGTRRCQLCPQLPSNSSLQPTAKPLRGSSAAEFRP